MASPHKTKNGFQDQLSLNGRQKFCRMLQREHSAILLTFIKLPVGIKTFVLSIFEWPFYTDLLYKQKGKEPDQNVSSGVV